MITAEELADAEGEYRSVAGRAEILRGVRDRMVRDAIRDGWTKSQVAHLTGLSRQRVGQIAEEEK